VLLHEIVVTSASAGLLAMSAARQRLAECPAWITSQVGRPTMRWSATEIPFPQITDETLAIRSVAPMLLVGQATGDQVTMRTGDVFNQIGYASIGTHDPEELGRYARLAAEKLTASMATP
jgi:hypothetical protein